MPFRRGWAFADAGSHTCKADGLDTWLPPHQYCFFFSALFLKDVLKSENHSHPQQVCNLKTKTLAGRE